MKRFIYSLSILLITACNSLDIDPLSDISTSTFFTSEEELKMYANSFYSILPAEISKDDAQSDNMEGSGTNLVVRGKHVEPSSGGGWDWGYLRNVNYFLKNYSTANLSEEAAGHYKGLACFFRAWFYFNKVKQFGAVPWYSEPLEANNPALYKARDPRNMVLDSMLTDLNYACEHVRETAEDGAVNRWVAYALKARVCLHEGTFRKYHGLEGEDRFLQEAYKAAEGVMNSGKYKLYTTGHPLEDYAELFVLESYQKDEVLLARRYDRALHTTGHTSNSYALVSTQSSPGATKSLVDSYLMLDGTSFTSKPGNRTMMLKEEAQNRDPRLSQTIRTPGYKRYGATEPAKPFLFFGAAATGYQLAKHIAGEGSDGWQGNYNDIPVFRYAEVLLIYAEAKAELGILSAADLAKSIDLLRSRVGMPGLPLTVSADPFLEGQYPNVQSSQRALVLEIRRERRVELALEGFRYGDLMRWKAGRLLSLQFQGMYFPSKGAFDMDGDGTIDVELVDKAPSPKLTDREYIELKAAGPILSEGDKGYLLAQPVTAEGKDKSFDESKHYYFPLPLDQFVINPNLEQNPGWRKE